MGRKPEVRCMSNPQHEGCTDQQNAKTEDTTPDVQAAPGAPPEGEGRLKNGRFGKGYCGNRKGRPKNKERAWSFQQLDMDILAEANKLVSISVDGKIERISMYALMLRQLMIKGGKGNTKAAAIALQRLDRAQSAREMKHHHLYRALEAVERAANQPPLSILEAKSPEMLNIVRTWSRKV